MEGGKINHLSVKRLQQGAGLYEEREDWKHTLVSGSCMHTSSCEGGGKHSQSCVVCLQRVQVYNREEESKIDSPNGQVVARGGTLVT